MGWDRCALVWLVTVQKTLLLVWTKLRPPKTNEVSYSDYPKPNRLRFRGWPKPYHTQLSSSLVPPTEVKEDKTELMFNGTKNIDGRIYSMMCKLTEQKYSNE